MEELLRVLMPLIILVAISLAQKKSTAAKKRQASSGKKPVRQRGASGQGQSKGPSLSDWIKQMQEEASAEVVPTPEPIPEEVSMPAPTPVPELPNPPQDTGRERGGGRPRTREVRPTVTENLNWTNDQDVEPEEAVELGSRARHSSRRRNKDSSRASRGGARIKLVRKDLRRAIILREIMGPPKGLED